VDIKSGSSTRIADIALQVCLDIHSLGHHFNSLANVSVELAFPTEILEEMNIRDESVESEGLQVP